MALAFQGRLGTVVSWGLVTQVEVKASGGSFQVVGWAENINCIITPLTKKGDPSDTDIVTALRITLSFTGLQTGKSNELTNLDDVAGNGLYDTDCEVKLTFASTARTLTIGAVAGYPCRIIPTYNSNGDDTAQVIEYNLSHVEPYTGGVSGKFSA